MNKEIIDAISDLNNAINYFFNHEYGLPMTGMGDLFVQKILAAQEKLDLIINDPCSI